MRDDIDGLVCGVGGWGDARYQSCMWPQFRFQSHTKQGEVHEPVVHFSFKSRGFRRFLVGSFTTLLGLFIMQHS